MSATRTARRATPSRRLLAAFCCYLRWYIGRHFHALRIAHGERFPLVTYAPLIVYLNHPSWWDPLTGIMVARHFLPKSDHYAPMDEAALRHYSFFRKLGLFPVEMHTSRGALQFVRSSQEVLSRPNSVLWLTPQGGFTDPRTLPLVFKDGLATLLSRRPQATVLPLAVEYIYWDERLPEILVNCGVPIQSNEGDRYSVADWNHTLVAALSDAQQELAALAMTRDTSRFEPLLAGGTGIGAIYNSWQRIRSVTRGERYAAEHGSIRRS